MKMKLKDFNETFRDELRDPEFAAEYLEAALEEDLETFLLALREVTEANGGMTNLSKMTSLGRESMYKSLSANGNPQFKNLQVILKALGLRFSVMREDDSRKEGTPVVSS